LLSDYAAKANQLELRMAKLFCCRYCRVELAPIALGDSTAILLCLDCDVIGLVHHVRVGAPMHQAGERGRARSARRRAAKRETPQKRAA
jgi:hypothetical protein